MAKVLYIKANPKPTSESFTLQAAEAFIQAYQEAHPDDEVKTMDLYNADIEFLSNEDLLKMMKREESHAKQLAEEFASYDKYIFAAPMWNFSVPAILKAYVDNIVVAGTTFEYGEQGPSGLLENKKMLHVTARGGIYSTGPYAEVEMGDKYLRAIMGFLGVESMDTIAIEGTAMGEDKGEAALQEAMAKAQEMAKSW